ncbi:hypothetical protein NUW58_g8911 [Xylaria curta]|uniref:Uncharacterized protein n=1 Tax=Xylaria curta TaxID=42375 RepID=A0ACC1N531_9PEZI|nr:hypothetical protein NUW58_g8911 [Xylaria curta]
MFTFQRDGPLPTMWNNLTTRASPLRPLELEALTGRTVLVAGATSGCGLQLAKILARHCTRLIITARNPQRRYVAIGYGVLPVDPDFTEQLLHLPSLDIAVLNAGVWHVQFTRSADSFETHLQVNYLASCALSLSLLTVLSRGRSPPHSRPGRLLNVTSEGHAFEDVPTGETASGILERFNSPNALTCYQRYRLSKLLSMIWTHELASSIDSAARRVEIASFTPGATNTQICRDLGTGNTVDIMMSLFCQSAEQGAWAYVRALIAQEYHGQYFFREHPHRPTYCVTAEEYKSFREDLVRQTVAVLGNQLSTQSGIDDWLGFSPDDSFP